VLASTAFSLSFPKYWNATASRGIVFETPN
jgi:hypothetical protein